MYKPTDLVISGIDFSGTSTQIDDAIEHFQALGLRVRDLRGDELDALYHAEKFEGFNQKYISLSQLRANRGDLGIKPIMQTLSEEYQKQKPAAMVKGPNVTYINPESADIWVLEEPQKRGPGAHIRQILQHSSAFGIDMNQRSQAYAFSADRENMNLRFRYPILDAGKSILRSRSEESTFNYQILDSEHNPSGIELAQLANLPGNKMSMDRPPTHIFLVHGPIDWLPEEYAQLREQRTGNRTLDDHEKNTQYQLFINRRYGDPQWLESIYREFATAVPKISRFDIHMSKDEIKAAMGKKLDQILKE